MKVAAGAIACLAVLACAATAQAEQRYATPAGSGSACSQPAPCSLEKSLAGAKSNDEVIVGTGSYIVSSTIFVPAGVKNLNIHGDLSGPMPTIAASVTGLPISISESDERISYLEITNTVATSGLALLCESGWHVERVRLAAASPGANALTMFEDCVVRDSLVRSEGSGSAALLSGGTGGIGVARNVTAIGTGSGSIGVGAFNSGTHVLDLKNTIASGEGYDLKAYKGGFGSGTMFVSNSNFETTKTEEGGSIIDLGGNQTAAPLFVDAPGRDYREAAGSPTIDAGVADQIGALDLAGNARVLGAAPDIGAFEFVPTPPPVAGQIQLLSLKPAKFRAGNVSGAIASRRKKPTARLGTTVSYSLSAAASVSFTLQKLTPGRRVGRKCVKQTRQNKGHKKCVLTKPLKGGFSNSGVAGQNTFKFSGRLGGKSLKPGRYELVGSAGGASKRTPFTIVK
jgi:hypothetical protein